MGFPINPITRMEPNGQVLLHGFCLHGCFLKLRFPQMEGSFHIILPSVVLPFKDRICYVATSPQVTRTITHLEGNYIVQLSYLKKATFPPYICITCNMYMFFFICRFAMKRRLMAVMDEPGEYLLRSETTSNGILCISMIWGLVNIIFSPDMKANQAATPSSQWPLGFGFAIARWESPWVVGGVCSKNHAACSQRNRWRWAMKLTLEVAGLKRKSLRNGNEMGVIH